MAKSVVVASSSEGSSQIVEAFQNVTKELKTHRAYDHSLFKYMAERARNGSLTAQQFDFFRHIMFSRIHLTAPSIAEMILKAIKHGDYEVGATALKNLMEEGAMGNIEKMHPKEAMDAFNTLGKEIFGLSPTTMANEYENLQLPQEIIYHATIERLYKKHGVFVSYAQELSSGGNEKSLGMMGDIYSIFYAYKDKIPSGRFTKDVLPYFHDHINLTPEGEMLPNTDSVEDMHRQRAEKDVLEKLTSLESVRVAGIVMRTFAEAQGQLFDAALQTLKEMEREKEQSTTQDEPKGKTLSWQQKVGNLSRSGSCPNFSELHGKTSRSIFAH